MTASSSVISISNRSLLSIGSRSQISALDENSVESNAISVLFQPTFESLARAAYWGCLRAQASLTLLAAAQGTPENVDGTTLPLPPTPWLYQYAVPSNSLAIRFIVPSFTNSTPSGSIPLTTASYTNSPWIPGIGQIQFNIAYSTDSQGNPIETILCNQTQAQAVFTANIANPVIWDSLFEAAFVASLAAFLVPALSLDLALMDRVVKQADAAITIARTRDGNETPVSQNRNASWMQARLVGGALGFIDAGISPYAFGNYGNMAWPVG